MTHFHLIGIGGAGMSVVAELLADRGNTVSGSDRAESPAMDHLRSLGIDAIVGQSAENVPEGATVVVSSAIRDSNPELARARELGLEVIHRSQALALAAEGRRFVAVAGAHGKTTTSAMLATVLDDAGEDPSYAIGGVIRGRGTGAHLGTGDVFVAEADESDGSFLNYSPYIALVTNVEPDHLDHYGSKEAFEQAFVDFADRIVEDGALVCCAEDDGAMRLARRVREAGRVSVLTYGRPEQCPEDPDCAIGAVELGARGTRFTVTLDGTTTPVEMSAPGLHNVLNGAGTFAVASLLGVDSAAIAHGLAQFGGTERRFEFRGEVGGRRLFDDYAHHPTEVAAAVAEARTVAGEGTVTVLFQPHLYSRTRNFADRFADALSGADEVVVTGIYAAREDPMEGVDSSLITSRLPGSHLVEDMDEAAVAAADLTSEGGVCVTMGAGSVTTLGDRILARWEQQ